MAMSEPAAEESKERERLVSVSAVIMFPNPGINRVSIYSNNQTQVKKSVSVFGFRLYFIVAGVLTSTTASVTGR